MECYLDNAATTKVDFEAAQLMQDIMLEDYGNTASLHRKGFEAEQHIRKAREIFAGILKCRESELIFTSGGTESDNLALIGTYFAGRRRGNHIITTRIEHPAVAQTIGYLASLGAKIDYLDVNRGGHINLEQLDNMLGERTLLVSVMHVNNEIGAEEPIAQIGKLIHDRQPDCLFHVDDVQGFGKLSLVPKDNHIDLLSVSSHKLHGPKGVGLLYKSDRTRLVPMIYGGGHQKGYRSGTENVPGVAGFACAASKCYGKMKDSYAEMGRLKQIFLEEIAELEDIRVNGGDVPYIISLSVKDVRAEVLVHALEQEEIYVSAGSACSSNRPQISATLKAIGVEPWQLESTVRISLSSLTEEGEIRYAAEGIKEAVPRLRRVVRK